MKRWEKPHEHHFNYLTNYFIIKAKRGKVLISSTTVLHNVDKRCSRKLKRILTRTAMRDMTAWELSFGGSLDVKTSHHAGLSIDSLTHSPPSV